MELRRRNFVKLGALTALLVAGACATPTGPAPKPTMTDGQRSKCTGSARPRPS